MYSKENCFHARISVLKDFILFKCTVKKLLGFFFFKKIVVYNSLCNTNKKDC